jgi:hypothetical protein
MFIGITVVFFAIAAIAVDGSLWQSQRRTAQKDADASAFAAGYDLLHRQYPASPTTAANIQSAAQASALQWVTRNGLDSSYFTNGSPVVPLTTSASGCFGAGPYDAPNPDSVTVDVQKQGTSFFTSIFGLFGANVGAHAKVCVGSPADASGLLPFAIQILGSPCFDNSSPPKPLFGQTCKVEVRPPQGQSGETGVLKLYNDGSTLCSASNVGQTNQTLEQNVANGANTTCEVAPTTASASQCPMLNLPDAGIGKCVWSDTGNAAGTVLQGLQDRLAKEGQSTPPYNCDALFPDTWFNTNNVNPPNGPQNGPPNYNNDHVDQWWEALNVVDGDDHNVVPGPSVTFNKRSCTSPRIVTLVLIDQFAAQGQGPYPIRGFAAFYINGCSDSNGVFNSRCVTGNCRIGQGNNPCPNPKNEPTLQNNGQVMMDGIFINYVDVGSHGGPLNQFGRIQLFLVE